MGKIDQIRTMRHNVLSLVIGMLFTVVVECRAVVGEQVGVRPFALRFEKECKGVGADVCAVENSIVDT